MRNETYDMFVEKFKLKKTTDDCYTPEPVYNVIADWVAHEYGIDAKNFVRPFYPGGNYENFDYSEDCVVVDNPPFSILSQILQFYLYYGIKFFLFGQAKTIFHYGKYPLCIIGTGADIVFENGASISISFLTNLESPGVRSAPELYAKIKETQAPKDPLPKYEYPPEVLTFYKLQLLSKKGINIKIDKKDMGYINTLDSQRMHKKSIYGAGFLLSKVAAVKVSEAVEAEKTKEITYWALSDREREIVKSLDAN